MDLNLRQHGRGACTLPLYYSANIQIVISNISGNHLQLNIVLFKETSQDLLFRLSSKLRIMKQSILQATDKLKGIFLLI